MCKYKLIFSEHIIARVIFYMSYDFTMVGPGGTFPEQQKMPRRK
jgi:hypothetical protein